MRLTPPPPPHPRKFFTLALDISTFGTNGASLPAEPLHPVPPNATKNPDVHCMWLAESISIYRWRGAVRGGALSPSSGLMCEIVNTVCRGNFTFVGKTLGKGREFQKPLAVWTMTRFLPLKIKLTQFLMDSILRYDGKIFILFLPWTKHTNKVNLKVESESSL